MLVPQVPPSSKEAEEGLIGCLLIGSNYIEEAAGTVTPDMFYYPEHETIMRAIIEVHRSGSPVDIITVTNALRKKGEKPSITIRLMELSSSIVSDANAPTYAQIIIQKHINRQAIKMAMEVQEAAYEDDVDVVIARSSSMADSLLSNIPFSTAESLADVVGANIREIDERQAHKNEIIYVDTGIGAIDRVLGGFDPGALVVIAGRPSMGKAQPLSSKIKTIDGWTTMGELQLGQHIASIDGGESIITGIFPQGKMQTYVITFSDGRSTHATADHLWTVMYRDWESPRVLETSHIAAMLERSRYKNRLWIEAPSGDYGIDNDLIIDPWMLGVLIGNGCLSKITPMISTSSKEVLEEFSNKLDDGITLVQQRSNPYDYRISGEGGGKPNPITQKLKQLGLYGRHSFDKFIPKQYLSASKQSREELLRGLIDTDGYIDKTGAITYSTASPELAINIIELVRSLGGWCSARSKQPYYTYNGERRKGRISYTIYISNIANERLSSVPFKRDRIKPVMREKRINFTSIVPVAVTDTQCISVSHPSQSYITDDYIVTHNTALALQLAYNIGIQHHVLFFTLEMTRAEIGNRYLTMLTDIDTIRLKRGTNIIPDEWRLIEKATADIEGRKIIIDDTSRLTIYNLRSKVYRLVRSKGVRVVIIDYLQLMEGAKGKEGAEYYGTISRTCKQIAKELKIVVILLSQLNREVEKRGEKIPRLHDLRSSGEIEQDADIVIFPVRCDKAGIDDPANGLGPGKAIISIAKNRNGRVENVVINVSANAAKWWDEDDIFAGPQAPPAPHYLDKIEKPDF